MRIFFIGFMGSGKTGWGKRLAKKLNIPFFDLDHLIEEQTGSTISDYFKQKGEEHFRAIEADILRTYSFPPDCIVSTGGGTPCFKDNMTEIKKQGIAIYISLPTKALINRLTVANTKEQRPLLQNLPDDALANFIEERLALRQSYYQKADFIVDGLNLSLDRLLAVLENYQK